MPKFLYYTGNSNLFYLGLLAHFRLGPFTLVLSLIILYNIFI